MNMNEEQKEVNEEEQTAENPGQAVETEPEEQGKEDQVSPELESLKEENDRLNQKLLRVQADFENFKRRSKEEESRIRKYRAQSLVEELLPALDNFKRALAVETDDSEAASIKQGMDMVYRQLSEALKKEGAEEIAETGVPFDPNFHQAVMQVESDEHPTGTVVEVLQSGYMLHDRVVRAAMVKVSQ